jgi:transmembrane sensor
MNTVESMGEIERHAAEWILKRDRGGVTDGDRVALESWLSQDARHREAYLALDEFWDLTAGMRQWNPHDGNIDQDILAPLGARPRRPGRVRAWSIAAGILAICIGAGWLGISALRGERYSTSVGGFERIALDDGSVMQLNTDTVLHTRFTKSQRSVSLFRGEAYFDVAPDPLRPFEVRVGKTVARVVGTAFSVRVGAGERLELLVTQGKVLLLPDDARDPAPLIVAGQAARADASSVAVDSVARPEMGRRLAWQGGQLEFDRQSLSSVAEEFNRYNRRQVRISGESLQSLQFTGNFRATDLESFVAAIESAADVEVDRTDDVLVIRPR